MKDLVRKRWVTKQHSVEDRRALCLQLSGQGETLVRRIMDSVRDVRMQLDYKEVPMVRLRVLTAFVASDRAGAMTGAITNLACGSLVD